MNDALPPHPPLPRYYGEPAEREEFVREIFDETAEWYDSILQLLSFGVGQRYRHDALLRAGLKPGMKVLDVATGTGAVARAAAMITNDVVGMDPSIGMLLAGRVKKVLPAVQAKTEALPFRDRTFDLLTVGFALRHFADLRLVFSEYHRVLKPGGRALILEITRPSSRVGYLLLRFHLDRVVPMLTRLRTGSAEAAKLMHYYWDTIDACVPPSSIEQALAGAGFGKVHRHVVLGVFSEYRAER